MAWAKVDDQWFAHRKVVGLSLAARGLWTTTLSWSCAQRTDHLPEHMIRFLAGGEETDELADELERAGLWHRNGTGWVIHDWAKYQERPLSEKRAEAGSKGGKRSGEVRRAKSDDTPDEANAKQTKQTDEANSEAGTRPGPTRPDPTDFKKDFWDRYPKRNGKRLGQKQAKDQWAKLTVEDRQRAVVAVGHYAAAADDPDVFCPIKDPWRWLQQRLFDDWQEPAVPSSRDGPKTAQVDQHETGEF
jgi:hypothetical protein